MIVTKENFETVTNLNFERCITVKELIKVLELLDPDSKVFCDDNAGSSYPLLGLCYHTGYVSLNSDADFQGLVSSETINI